MSAPDPSEVIADAIGILPLPPVSEDDAKWFAACARPGAERNPGLLVRLVHRLMQAQQFSRALEVNRILLAADPENPVVLARNAHLLHRSAAWPEAIAAYEVALARAAPERREAQATAWARCLIESRRTGEAITRIEALVKDFPDSDTLLRLLSQALLTGGKFAAVISLAEQHRARVPQPAALVFFNEISACARLGARERVIVLLTDRIKRSQSAEAFRHCLTALDHVTPGQRAPLLNALRTRVSERLADEITDGDERAALAILQLRFAIYAHEIEAFVYHCDRLHAADPEFRLPAALADIHKQLKGASKPRKVFGIGLSKTGTSSLDKALGMLGYRSAHFLNPATSITLCLDDSAYFDAMTDTPVSWEFERYHARWPDARFVYTVRDLDRWKRSLLRHFLIDRGESDWEALCASNVRMRSDLPEIEGSLYFSHDSPEAAWMHHDRRVREFFSGERASQLLIIDIEAGEGWGPLCAFLDEPVPESPFPHENPHRLL